MNGFDIPFIEDIILKLERLFMAYTKIYPSNELSAYAEGKKLNVAIKLLNQMNQKTCVRLARLCRRLLNRKYSHRK